MSEHIKTLDETKVITSLAARGKYHLAVYDRDKAPEHFLFMGSDKSYKFEEYCDLLGGLWDEYIIRAERPKLLGIEISDEGLITETRHCLAPNSWWPPPGDGAPLTAYRESLLYWLQSQAPQIQARIGNLASKRLKEELEDILRVHLERKHAS